METNEETKLWYVIIENWDTLYKIPLDFQEGEYYGSIPMTVGTPISIASNHDGEVFTVSYNLGSMRDTALFEMECESTDIAETIETFLQELYDYNGIRPIFRREDIVDLPRV